MTQTLQATDSKSAYMDALRDHDWAFEYSDDARVWRSGKQALEELAAAQACFDPDFALWSSIAPPAYRVQRATTTLALMSDVAAT